MSANDNLIIEDGTGVTDSNTYIDVDYLLNYCDNRGLSLSASSDYDFLATKLFLAFDYTENQRSKYQGQKTNDANSAQFPRAYVYIDDAALASDEIPKILKDAQARLAYDLDKNSLSESEATLLAGNKGAVIKEEVDVIKVTYATPSSGDSNSLTVYTEVENLLSPLYAAASISFIKK